MEVLLSVDGTVNDLTKRRSPISSGGLEIQVKLYFRSQNMRLVEQMERFVVGYDYNWEDSAINQHNSSEDDAADPSPDGPIPGPQPGPSEAGPSGL